MAEVKKKKENMAEQEIDNEQASIPKKEKSDTTKKKPKKSREQKKIEDLNQQLNNCRQGLINAYRKNETQVQDTIAMAKSESVMNSEAMNKFDTLIETMVPVFVSLAFNFIVLTSST